MSNKLPKVQDAPDVILKRLEEWRHASADELRLRCGELTAQEIRTIRAVINAIVGTQ
jgi:hypothetical protein